MKAAGTTVVLLRSPAEDGPDKYLHVLQDSGYDPINVPVLEHGFTAVSDLRRILSVGPSGAYSGVIITSSRAVEAWYNAAEGTEPIDENVSWQDTPFYVVGPKTAEALQNGTTDFPHFSPNPDSIRGAAESGNAQRLAEFIVDDVRDKATSLLYLTGDKNRDTITKVLGEAGVPVVTQQVYETSQRAGLREDIEAVSRKVAEKDGSTSIWISFFAPSSAEMALPILATDFHLPLSEAKSCPPVLIQARFASIGPTTLKYLTKEHPSRFRVDASAASPTPERLAEALLSFDRRNNMVDS